LHAVTAFFFRLSAAFSAFACAFPSFRPAAFFAFLKALPAVATHSW